MSAVIPFPETDAEAVARWAALAENATAQAVEYAAEADALRAEIIRLTRALSIIASASLDPPDDLDDIEAMSDAQWLQSMAQRALRIDLFEIGGFRQIGDVIRKAAE